MNIYFACSITGGREFERVYQDLTAALVRDGHEVPTAPLAESNVLSLEAVVAPREVYERDVTWIRAAHAVVAEVSVPSHGVGYEIGVALNAGKPVLCLFQEGRKISKMISGNPHPQLHVMAYKDSTNAVELMRKFLADLK
ncbi:MAG TPA: nucleoside 2-deoxyribosyltransferase [Anaerolineales bacterium]|nr:nucleoside 2-deoxyribosyltransferase [Anaerolineales bacterium]